MRISPITINTNDHSNKQTNQLKFKGKHVNYKIIKELTNMSSSLSKSNDNNALNYLIRFRDAQNAIDNKMGKFSPATRLAYEQKGERTYSAFIDNPYSNYKYILPDLKLSENNDAVADLEIFENFVKQVQATNQFEIERDFCIMRDKNANRSDFKPIL